MSAQSTLAEAADEISAAIAEAALKDAVMTLVATLELRWYHFNTALTCICSVIMGL